MSKQVFDVDLLGTKGDYAGIGSRKLTGKHALFQMQIGMMMTLSGYSVSSGAADLSDTSFEYGAKMALRLLNSMNYLPDSAMEDYSKVMKVYLPWPGFNGRDSGPGYLNIESQKAMDITSKYHAGWDELDKSVKNLMSRNAMQILGPFLDKKVKFVICETPDGAFSANMTSPKTGGTGQAIRIADSYGVKVFNIANEEHKKRLQKWVIQIKNDFMDNYGEDPLLFLETQLKEFKGIKNNVEGDLIEMASEGEFDVIVHGLSCQNTKGAGFAESLFKEFPTAYDADQKTKKGDKRKLGTYSMSTELKNGKNVTVVNAYTQQFWGRKPDVLYADYEAIRKVFKKIAKDFKGKKIGVPRIGAGLANGCWVTISNIIQTQLKYADLTLVDLPNAMELESSHQDLPSMDEFKLPMTQSDGFVFFWGKEDPFSQWHPSEFKDKDGNVFSNAEQYMMHEKARLFGDEQSALKILNVLKDPQKAKAEGRKVKNFDEELWNKHRVDIVFKGSVLKFSQNPKLLMSLLKSDTDTLVEASKFDKIWGIGMAESHPNAKTPAKWKGENLLGVALERARHYIINHPEILSGQCKEIHDDFMEWSGRDNKKGHESQLSLI